MLCIYSLWRKEKFRDSEKRAISRMSESAGGGFHCPLFNFVASKPPSKISPRVYQRERSLFAVEGKRRDVGCGSPHAQLARHPPLRFTYGSHPRLANVAVARTVSPQLSWLWLLLRHPPILSLSLSLAHIFVDPFDRWCNVK